MPKTQLLIPKFESLDKFQAWFASPEVTEFCQRHPDKVQRLVEHRLVKPWLAQLRGKSETVIESEKKELEQIKTTGKSFGKYVIERELGKGGMGVVYLAFDPVLGRKVALKIMLLKSRDAVERFTREARAAAKLKHPYIIQVYDIGIEGKYNYFTMEYIAGVSMDKLIKEKKTPIKRMAEIVLDIASALQYAHSAGIIHRDIKPANIIIDSEGKAHLADFGLARDMAGLDRSLTMSGTVVGTPDYMSPEQAMALKDEIDQRTDVFSLGATLYHSVTGHLPFHGRELYQVLDSVVNKEPLAPSRLVKTLPRDLETIALKCLEKDKKSRYQSAQLLADDLKSFLKGEPIAARSVSMLAKLQRRMRRNKAASYALAGIVIILLAFGIWQMSSSISQSQGLDRLREQANIFFSADKFEEARGICNRILGLSPDDRPARELVRKCNVAEIAKHLGQVKELLKQDKFDEALALCRQALKIEPDNAQVQALAGQCDKGMKDKQAKVEAAQRRAKAMEIITAMGIAASLETRLELALEAVKVDPTFAEAYSEAGVIYLDLNDFDNALVYFNKAIELSPNDARFYVNRGFSYQWRKEFDKAIRDYNTAIKIDANCTLAYFHRADIYSDRDDYGKAIADYTECIRCEPSAEAYNSRGNIYFEKGEFDKAIADYTGAIKINPQGAPLYFNRARAYSKKGDYKRAIGDFTMVLQLKPDDVESYFMRGQCHAMLGNFPQAIKDSQKSLELDPKNKNELAIRQCIREWEALLNK